MVMSARAVVKALGTFVVCAVLACKQDIPKPVEDGGQGAPADVSSIDGPASRPDLAADVSPPPTCGNGGQSCCAGNVCTGGGCCVSGQCVANGTACRPDATCLEGSCGGCGAARPQAQECCTGRACTASRAVCLGAGTGMCQVCGASGQSCCGDGFCEGNLRCDTGAAPTGMCVPK
jgi:hypothetical protein